MQPKYDAGVRFKQILKSTENIVTSLTELSSLLLECHSCYSLCVDDSRIRLSRAIRLTGLGP